MKRLLMTLLALGALTLPASAQAIQAYLCDYDESEYTNIRNAPGGKVVYKLKKDAVVFTLVDVRNGWWRIEGDAEIWGDEEVTLKLPKSKTGLWIHSSVVGFTPVGGEDVVLRKAPSDKSEVVLRFKYPDTLRPLMVKGKYVKVRVIETGVEGWLERDKICFNPLTNCC